MFQSRDVDRKNKRAVKEANFYFFIESGKVIAKDISIKVTCYSYWVSVLDLYNLLLV